MLEINIIPRVIANTACVHASENNVRPYRYSRYTRHIVLKQFIMRISVFVLYIKGFRRAVIGSDLGQGWLLIDE